MTAQELIAEGRALQRKCFMLRPEGDGPVAAIWHENDRKEIQANGRRRWITIDTSHLTANLPSDHRFLTIYSDEEEFEGGSIVPVKDLHTHKGLELRAYEEEVLPPIDLVFLRGSERVGDWLVANGWQRDWGYNDNFQDRVVTDPYEELYTMEHPIYRDGIYAMLGGWHSSWPDDDWLDLIDEQLLVLTLQDSEPWVEAWKLRDGDLRVIRRTT